MALLVQYYPTEDMLYIQLDEGISHQSSEVAPNIVLDYDRGNRVIDIEIEKASSHVDLGKLENSTLPLVNFIMKQS